MTSFTATCQEILRLDKEATKGDWSYDKLGEWIWRMNKSGDVLIDHICDMRGVGGNLPIDNNANLIAYYRTHCPAIAARLMVVEGQVEIMKEALDYYANKAYAQRLDHRGLRVALDVTADWGCKAKQALAKIQEMERNV